MTDINYPAEAVEAVAKVLVERKFGRGEPVTRTDLDTARALIDAYEKARPQTDPNRRIAELEDEWGRGNAAFESLRAVVEKAIEDFEWIVEHDPASGSAALARQGRNAARDALAASRWLLTEEKT